MKKKVSLTLSRETLRLLDDLAQVAGGTSCGDPSCFDNCNQDLTGQVEPPESDKSQCSICC